MVVHIDNSRSSEELKSIKRKVIEKIIQLHERDPKYIYDEESERDFIERIGVRVENIPAAYCEEKARRVAVLNAFGKPVAVEDFAVERLSEAGYHVIRIESVPFQVIFSTFCWLLIQDPSDPLVRNVQFGRRDQFEAGEKPVLMGCMLPEDFGTKGYANRRARKIKKYFKENFCNNREDWLHLFDYWQETSWTLRQYLWAHRERDSSIARQVVEILTPAQLISVLSYLLDGYWDHYLGWPDLLAVRDKELLFVEVKSARDKLSEDQKRWIEDNEKILNFDFMVMKITRNQVRRKP